MSKNEVFGLHRITKKHLKELCKKHRLYQTPYLNDQLYLHYQGFQAIENLEEYTGLKCLWLENNAISEIRGLESLKELKCLFLQNNLISKIENLQCCPELDTLNLASNHITRIENCGVDVLPVLSTLNLSRNYLKNSGALQELINCSSLWSLDLANNRIDDILVVKIFASMPELRVLVLQGNPVVSQVPQYRKTLILECKNLTYLDSRPVFPKDRACAEAWKRGGYEEERREHERWIRMDRKKIRDSVNATLRLRRAHGDDIQLLESTDEEDGNGLPKKRKPICDKVTPDLEITGVVHSGADNKNPTTSNEIVNPASVGMGDVLTSLEPTHDTKKEEVDNTPQMVILSDDMPAEKDDVDVSKSEERFEEIEPNDEGQSDEKPIEVVEEKDASDVTLQSEENVAENLDEVGEKSALPQFDEANTLQPSALELQAEQNDDILKYAEKLDVKPAKVEEDIEMEPDQDLTDSDNNERVDLKSSGSEPDLQEVVKACIAKSRCRPVLMKGAPGFSKDPTAWKRFNSSGSSSTSDVSSTSDISSDEGDTFDEREDMAISDKETNISEPNDADFKSLDEDLETNELLDEVEVVPTEIGMEVSDFTVGEDKTRVTTEPTETAVEVSDSEVGEVKERGAIESSETQMEVSDFGVGDDKTSVTAEPTETAIDVGEVKASVAIEPSKTQMEISDFAAGEDKITVTAEPTETRREVSDFAIHEEKTSALAEPSEIRVEVSDFGAGDDKTSFAAEPTETRKEVSDFAVPEGKTSVSAEPSEVRVEVSDFGVDEDKTSITAEPDDTETEVLDFAVYETKTSAPAEPSENKMETSHFAVREVKNTAGFEKLTRSGTIDLFAMELSNDIIYNLPSESHFTNMESSPTKEVQESDLTSKENPAGSREEHVDLQDSTLAEKESLSQSLMSDHDLDTTNWSFTEPDDSMPESLKMFDEIDTFDTDNTQAIDLSEGDDSGLVNSFQTTSISSEFENQGRGTPNDDDGKERSTPIPDESSAVALAGLEDILSQVCEEKEEKASSSKEPSYIQVCKEFEEINNKKPFRAVNKKKVTEDPEVSSWLDNFFTALRQKEEKKWEIKTGLDYLSAIMEEVDDDLAQMEAGLSNKPDDTMSTKELTQAEEVLTTPTVLIEDPKISALEGKPPPTNNEDLTASKKNSGPAWLQNILESLREKEKENEGDSTVIHKGEGLFSKFDCSGEHLHSEPSNNETSASKEKEAEKTGAWVRLEIEEIQTIHSEEASSNKENDCHKNDQDQSVGQSTEGKCEVSVAEEPNEADQFSESLTTFSASLDGEIEEKPDDLTSGLPYVKVPLTTPEPEALGDEQLSWWQQTLAAARKAKDTKPAKEPEAAPTPPTNDEDPIQIRHFEEEVSENQTLEEKAEAFRLLESVLAATRKEEIESLIAEPVVQAVVNALIEEDTQSTTSCDSSYKDEPLDSLTKPTPTLRQVIDSFNAVQETVALRTQQRSQRIKELIDNPLTKDFCAQGADEVNRQVDEMKMDQRKRINAMIDKVYAQKDKYNDTLEVVDGRLMVVKRGTGALEELPPSPSSKNSSCGVSTTQTDNTPTKYTSCGVSTNQTDNTLSKYVSCGVSTNQTDNTLSKYTTCGVNTTPSSNRNFNDSESDDYGTALSDEPGNEDDDGYDIEQHASDTKIKRIPYLVAGCSTLSQSSSSISREGDDEDIAHYGCSNQQQYESLKRVQQLHRDLDEEVFTKASKWMADGVDIPPMQPPILEKRKGKEEEIMMKIFLAEPSETSAIPVVLDNDIQSFMDFDEEALEDIALIFKTPDAGE